MVPLFGVAFRPQKTMLNPLANGKIQELFKAFECFSSTFQGKFYFQGLFKKSCIFKYFSSMCQPCIGLLYKILILFSIYLIPTKVVPKCH